jgi:hypothetical protein
MWVWVIISYNNLERNKVTSKIIERIMSRYLIKHKKLIKMNNKKLNKLRMWYDIIYLYMI